MSKGTKRTIVLSPKELELTLKNKLQLLSKVKYEAVGHAMVGVFNMKDNMIHPNKWFIYFRNPSDETGLLSELAKTYFDDIEECVDNAVKKLIEGGFIRE